MIPRISAVLRVAAILSGMALAACDPLTVAQLEAVTVIGSDKTVLDHAFSIGSGKNCSTVRKEMGMTYCVEDEKVVRQNIYCYRDLGGVTCYDRPESTAGGRARVDMNDHNRPK